MSDAPCQYNLQNQVLSSVLVIMNQEERSVYKRDWYLKNRDRIRQEKKALYQDSEYRQSVLAKQREYRQENVASCKQRSRNYYVKNRDKIIANVREWCQENSDALKQYKREWYQENFARISAESREYRKNNAEVVKQRKQKEYSRNRDRYLTRTREYRENNPDAVAECKKAWRIKNRDRYNLHNCNYLRIRRQSPLFRLIQALRATVKSALKENKKSTKTLNLIGCSIEFFRKYIESQFTKGMIWENYGQWHLDHVRPCASFDLSKEDQQLICFNWSNYQPLWAEDNLRKGAKFNGQNFRAFKS